MSENFSGFDEIRPGNFVYYDVMQYQLGACSIDNIAVAVACPIVSIFPLRGELAIYGGAVHLSKEHIEAENGFKLFGYVVRLKADHSWAEPISGAYVYSLSQEHGLIKMPEKDLLQFQPGDLIGVLPVHSCLTAHQLKEKILFI
jgi:D-serine deaminase-like pyridoxal phosphate-dependent protein